ncbi:MAG: hypothetical protein QNJ63_13655 [Calothrix sp. MO_192.B10]|nr:hypothetical protein [Calothrix sp. MO_192.B10]
MLHQVIVDTGVLVALIDRRDRSLPYLGGPAIVPDCTTFVNL